MTGTVIACDAPAAADLVFISHAGAWFASSRRSDRRRSSRHGRLQILTTTETLTLMGAAGERLRARALMPGYGRPFALGFLRLELISAGHQPGAASLLCDTGTRRLLYASTIRAVSPGSETAELRTCDALCVDVTFAHPRFRFLARAEADARLVEFAAAARSVGAVAVVLVSPRGQAQHAARALRSAGWRLRADRAIIDASALYARCGADVPEIARFAGKLIREQEVLLWSYSNPVDRRPGGPRAWAGLAAEAGGARVAWMSEWAGDADRASKLGVDVAIPASSQVDFEGLVAYVLASGAREVATLHGPSEALATVLRGRKIDVYPVGPPRQIGLFDG